MLIKNKTTVAHLALLFTNLFFAINLSAAKHLTNTQLAKPFGLNLVRVGVSTLLFWLLFILKPTTSINIEKNDWLRMALCALTGIAINQLLFLKGLSLTYPVHASLLMLSTPILIVVFSVWLLKEKNSWQNIIGLLLGITGAAVLILSKTNTANKSNIILGDVLILINAVSYTVYFIIVKPLMAKYNAIVIIRWIFTLGLLMILPFCWGEFMEIPWKAFSTPDMVAMVLVVFTGTFLAYLFNIYGIKILGAATAGFYIYTQPFFATAIAMIFLHEPLELYKVIAASLIFAGVYLSNKRKL